MTASPFEPLVFPEGKIALAGMVRVDEMGVAEFWVELPDRPKYYGAWSSAYEANERDFNVEIIIFGYPDKFNVGNKYPGAQLKFTKSEADSVKIMLKSLFDNQSIMKNISPFNMKRSLFTGDIFYRPGWILIKD